jgi:hypothetical protein
MIDDLVLHQIGVDREFSRCFSVWRCENELRNQVDGSLVLGRTQGLQKSDIPEFAAA